MIAFFVPAFFSIFAVGTFAAFSEPLPGHTTAPCTTQQGQSCHSGEAEFEETPTTHHDLNNLLLQKPRLCGRASSVIGLSRGV